eukprot:scaffold41812_cov32-Tisochrysis_lutea.AAC.7
MVAASSRNSAEAAIAGGNPAFLSRFSQGPGTSSWTGARAEETFVPVTEKPPGSIAKDCSDPAEPGARVTTFFGVPLPLPWPPPLSAARARSAALPPVPVDPPPSCRGGLPTRRAADAPEPAEGSSPASSSPSAALVAEPLRLIPGRLLRDRPPREPTVASIARRAP